MMVQFPSFTSHRLTDQQHQYILSNDWRFLYSTIWRHIDNDSILTLGISDTTVRNKDVTCNVISFGVGVWNAWLLPSRGEFQ